MTTKPHTTRRDIEAAMPIFEANAKNENEPRMLRFTSEIVCKALQDALTLHNIVEAIGKMPEDYGIKAESDFMLGQEAGRKDTLAEVNTIIKDNGDKR